MSVDMKSLGEYIRKSREACGISQFDLGIRLGWAPGKLSDYELGKRKRYLTPGEAKALSEILCVSEADLARSAGYDIEYDFVPDEYVELWAYRGDKLPDKAWAEIMEVVSKYHVDDEPPE